MLLARSLQFLLSYSTDHVHLSCESLYRHKIAINTGLHSLPELPRLTQVAYTQGLHPFLGPKAICLVLEIGDGGQMTSLALNLEWAKPSHSHCSHDTGVGPWQGAHSLPRTCCLRMSREWEGRGRKEMFTICSIWRTLGDQIFDTKCYHGITTIFNF
jgi:hypothetical protein